MEHEEERTIVYSDRTKGTKGDFPVAVVYTQRVGPASVGGDIITDVVDPIFSDAVTDNLYGRIMTLLEATVDPQRLKAVKDVFGKELRSWTNDVYGSARDLATGCDSSDNLYTRHRSSNF